MIQKILKIAVVASLICLCGCSKDTGEYLNHHGVVYPDGTVLTAESVDGSTAAALDALVEALFADYDEDIPYDRHMVINNPFDFELMGLDADFGIDWDTKTLLLGCIPSQTNADSIGDITLVYDAPDDLYRCTIDVYRPQSGYAVVLPLRYWRVFPKVESEVIYNINDIMD